MSPTTIAVLDPFHPDAITLLQSTPSITTILPNTSQHQNWHGQADGVILRSDTRLTEEDFAKATPRLRVVVKQGVGVDNIDLDAANKYGVAVHNTPALNSESVAELSVALAFSLSRRVTEIDRRIRKGETIMRSQTLGISLFEKTVGIVGMGNIGIQAARKWRGVCSANIIAYDPVVPKEAWADIPHKRVDTLQELLHEADVVTLHVPLLPTTKGLIGEKELSLMKENAILVNTARGGLVDEKALLEALKKGKLWGAVLDAMEVEPPTTDAYPELLSLDNVILTPHIGASTVETQSRSGCAAVKSVLAVLNGESNVPGRLV
ncbi:putative D-3-phosphoglycerate dehydrogenase [Emericellopsis atlantica]|uniref:D-3-phosphoglycerate dehydrogenase n=1 Tax=Emericellopsis atlantica TaxID=2614577 RepID=A0A9P7ZI96_9HYPO|nr:putative D-3-phosphoglycerate dehydrogenase [Emericellopsis atlantica]KAG9252549.1 putative D-3-phosphoglycerate dehydrogenase [Emericellopsis atlantica]